MLKTAAARQRGISLIEIMVSLSVGILLLLGLTSFMSSTLINNADSVKTTQFNQEIRAAMTLMVRDIRRAGAWGSPSYATGALSGVGVGLTYSNPFAAVDTTTSGCILYRYDKNNNATLDTGEYLGFRLNGGAIQMLVNATLAGSTCDTSDGWTALTNNANVNITALSFAETDSAPVYTNGTGSGPYVKVRYIKITMTAQSASDAKIKQTLEETVRLQNDLFSPV